LSLSFIKTISNWKWCLYLHSLCAIIPVSSAKWNPLEGAGCNTCTLFCR